MLYDTHTHTTNSDGRSSTMEMCAAALEKGLGGIMITDHANMNYYRERNTYRNLQNSVLEAAQAKDAFRGKLDVFCGVELGEYLYAPNKAKEILSLDCFDAILCSVHLVPEAGWSLAYNRIVFDETISDEELNEYLALYFDLLNRTVDAFDFDILAHIQCPVRYMNGKYGRTADAMLFEEKIAKILEKIIRRGIALEVNTARLYTNGQYNFRMEEILRLYRSLGGDRITLGSDAHQADAVAGNFPKAAELLRLCGFDRILCYEHRNPREILL